MNNKIDNLFLENMIPDVFSTARLCALTQHPLPPPLIRRGRRLGAFWGAGAVVCCNASKRSIIIIVGTPKHGVDDAAHVVHFRGVVVEVQCV